MCDQRIGGTFPLQKEQTRKIDRSQEQYQIGKEKRRNPVVGHPIDDNGQCISAPHKRHQTQEIGELGRASDLKPREQLDIGYRHQQEDKMARQIAPPVRGQCPLHHKVENKKETHPHLHSCETVPFGKRHLTECIYRKGNDKPARQKQHQQV